MAGLSRFFSATLLALSCALLVSPATAEVYKIVDEFGNVTYTDSPPEGAEVEEVVLPELITQPAIPVPQREESGDPLEFVPASQIQIQMVTPINQTVIPPGQMTIPVEVSLTRPLEENEVVQILLNGTLKAVSPSTVFMLDDLIRGEHTLQARVVDQGRTVKAQSQVITVYVQRATILN